MAAIASCTSKTETKVAGNSDTEAVERVIMSRRSVRQYTDKLINRDTLNRILECGINAPNGKTVRLMRFASSTSLKCWLKSPRP